MIRGIKQEMNLEAARGLKTLNNELSNVRNKHNAELRNIRKDHQAEVVLILQLNINASNSFVLCFTATTSLKAKLAK